MSRLPTKSKLLATFEANAEKRQREHEKASLWSSTTQYYKNWDRHNNIYQNWTSPEYYTTSNEQYTSIKCAERKKISLEERRRQLRKMLFEEEQELETELTISPRELREKLKGSTAKVSTETLKEINVGLKIAEEDRKRHEAEIKLYNQWKQNNPVIRDYESNQNRASLKLAWLDQQIEKRMEKEKTEEEIRQMIQERDKAIKLEEEMEMLEKQEVSRKQKEMMQEIQVQIEEMKLKETEASRLREEEAAALKKKLQLQEILERRNQDLQKRKQEEVALYNINQSKIKLRKKARDIEEQLKEDQKRIEEIKSLRPDIQDEAKKQELKRVMDQFLNYVKEQRNLEAQRQKYISFIFDSEAKNLWEKQDRLWKSEQESRDKLFQQVLDGLQEQIQQKIEKNVEKQREVLQEREEILHLVEENDARLKQIEEEQKEKKVQRRLELENQIRNKHLEEKQKEMEEEKRRQDELEAIKKEEERIKQEILKLQKREYPIKQKYNRKIIWWSSW